MLKIKSVDELQAWVASCKAEGKKVGFVPTMGYLHNGHLSLVKHCKTECDVVVVSVYVNPSQFNEASDFESYPTDLDRDESLLKDEGVDVVWMPGVDDIEGIPLDLSYNVNGYDSDLEGRYRDGHFKGVIEVVYRLFKAVLPHMAFFGEKDYQQFKVIKAMAKNNGLAVNVQSCATVREVDGLAMSSRNVRLKKEDRAKASYLHQGMSKISKTTNEGSRSKELSSLKSELINLGFEIEYLDAYSFEGNEQRLFAAVRLGGVRLIDNIELNHV